MLLEENSLVQELWQATQLHLTYTVVYTDNTSESCNVTIAL
jgi:hypothetical protein